MSIPSATLTSASTRRSRPRAEPNVLVDSFGRVARDLRVSITDKCNLRCTYCMPAEGLPWRAKNELLSTVEITRLVTIAVEQLGIRAVRFTGGEPLVRPDLEDIVASVAHLDTDIALTTNAIGLDRRANQLAAAGLRRVNISLDSLDRDRFAAMSRRDRLPEVLAGVDAAEAAGLTPVKINSVILRGINEADIVPLAQYSLDRGFELRFIEEMPIGPVGHWDRGQIVTQAEILQVLAAHFDLGETLPGRGSAPAAMRRLTGVRDGVVGVIPTVTEPFCATCNRTRLTADGTVMHCLFGREGVSLRDAMRSGATDAELAELWQDAQWTKPRAHGIDRPDFRRSTRTMSQIGG